MNLWSIALRGLAFLVTSVLVGIVIGIMTWLVGAEVSLSKFAGAVSSLGALGLLILGERKRQLNTEVKKVREDVERTMLEKGFPID